MPSIRIAVFMLALSTTATSAAVQVKCPHLVVTAEGTVHPLSDAKVFHGPASNKVEVKPVHGSFDVGAIMSTGASDPVDLVCLYSGTTDTQTVAVPRTATACDVADAGSGTVAGCH